MAKTSSAEVVLRLTDQQVRILAEAARMGIPEMLVRLSAISAATKMCMFLVGRILPNKAPAEVHLTQNINGVRQFDAERIGSYTKDLIKKGVVDAATKAADKAVFGEGEKVEEEESQPQGQELPKTTFEIPQQPTETPGETPGK